MPVRLKTGNNLGKVRRKKRGGSLDEEREMANDVTAFGGNVRSIDVQDMAKRAQESAENSPRPGAPNGSDYMNFSGKRGVFTIGRDKRRVENDEMWLVDVTSWEEGWVCWKGGQSPASRMANIYTGVPIQQPDPDELGPFDGQRGEGWFRAKGMVLKSLDNHQQGYFKINSVSGVAAISDLIGDFAQRAGSGLPCWPVVTLDIEEFEAQGYKNFKPVFNYVAWLSADQVQQLAEGADLDDLIEEDAPRLEEKAPAAEEKTYKADPSKSRRRRRSG